MADPLPPSVRVLCLVLHPGASGHAVVDGFGIPPQSFFSTRYLVRSARGSLLAVRRLLRRSLRRFRPQCLVIGVAPANATRTRGLREEVKRIARATKLDVVTRWVREGRLLFTGGSQTGAKHLADQLVQGFAPELAVALPALRRSPWYRRPAWDALALSLVELADREPRAAAALGHAHAHRIPNFARALARRDRERYPDPI